ncbi:MAG: YceI family protein [Candidatus Zixiibacteriota bacterium]
MKHSIILLLALYSLFMPADASEYHVDKTNTNLVMFVCEVPLTDFKVKTSQIDGYVYWDGDSMPPPESQSETSDIYFEVQLNSLDAGNSMYNRHLKEDYLETEKYPYAEFKASIKKIEQLTDSTFAAYVEGDFSIHGRKKKIAIVGQTVKLGDLLRVECEFTVKLSDYDIEIPKLMFIEADDDIKVNLDFYIKPSI